MHDELENTLSMALVVDRTLDETKDDWKHYGKLATDAGALKTTLGAVRTARQQLKAAEAAGGQIDAKDAAEGRALDAAMVIVSGAAASVLDAPNDVLAGVGHWMRSALDKERDTEQLAELEGIFNQASPLRAELVDDQVTDAHFTELQAATNDLRPFVGKARGGVVTAAALRRAETAAMDAVSAALARLDARMTVLRTQKNPVADRYFQARILVNAYGPGKAEKPAA